MSLTYQEHYTFKDYQHWKGNWELIEGLPYAMAPSPSVTHQTVALNIASKIKEEINNKPNCNENSSILMEMDWHVTDDRIVRPDVMIVCQDIEEKVMVTPELIIEVVSLSSTKRDEIMKLDLYQREGVMYYVLAYPEKHCVNIYHNYLAHEFKQLIHCNTSVATFNIGKCTFTIDFGLVWR